MKTTVSIPDIHCASCTALIKDVSAEFPAITNVEVDEDTKRVTLEYGEGFDLASWKDAIASLGETYTVHDLPV